MNRRCGYRCAVCGCGRRVLDRRGGGPGARYAVRRGAGGVGDVRGLGTVRGGLGRPLVDGVGRLGGAVVDGRARNRSPGWHRMRRREDPLRGGRAPGGREFVIPLRVRPTERNPQLEVPLVPRHTKPRTAGRIPPNLQPRDTPDRRRIRPHTGNPIPRSPELRVPLNPRHTRPRTVCRPPSPELEVALSPRHTRPRTRQPVLRSPQHEVTVGWCRGRCRGVALARPGNPPWPGTAPPIRLRGLPLVHALPTADRPRCAARRPTCGFNQVHAPRSRAPVSGRCWEAWARTWCEGRARRGGRRRRGPGSRTRTSG
jgi:hypothetical protein